jgi:phosphoglycerate dehydrogenase-like enzyme
MERICVLSTMRFSNELLAQIRAVSERIILTQHTSPDAEHVPSEAFEQAEVIYTFNALPQPDQAPHLRWVQLNSAGANHVIQHSLFATDVMFTTVSGLHAINIGEYVFASILAWSRHLPELFDLQRKSQWPSDRWTCCQPSELRRATIGIIGYGSIGREVGRLAKAFGMRVLALKRNAQMSAERASFGIDGLGDPQGALPDALYGPDASALREMLAQCDYVVLAVPLTSETRGMIGEAELRAMKPTAYLVNIARGEVCDEVALVCALQDKWIAGAGLDVFAEEPLPRDSPLWTLPNVILTPHISGFSPNYEQRAVDVFCENLRRYIDDQPLLNVVDRSIGY